MEWFPKNAKLPNNEELLTNINIAAGNLFGKIKILDFRELLIEDYSLNYLNTLYLNNLKNVIQKYSYMLVWGIGTIGKPLNEICLLDYGGGTGFLSLLAKEANIGKVIYCDIYKPSVKDAKIIAINIGNEADYYICGDIDETIQFFHENSLYCDCIVNSDVIEHIYNMEYFLKKVNVLSNEKLVIFLSSTANTNNPIISRNIKKKQIFIEYSDRIPLFGQKTRDSLLAYNKIRKEIIQNYAPSLKNDEIEILVKRTRGLNKDDIEQIVLKYIQTHLILSNPKDSTNTCDPYTGNWCENLMNLQNLKKTAENYGFKSEIKCGYYSTAEGESIKLLIYQIGNYIINRLNNYGLIISPFYSLYGKIEKN